MEIALGIILLIALLAVSAGPNSAGVVIKNCPKNRKKGSPPAGRSRKSGLHEIL
jgi:hypothetical protein